MTDFLAKNGIHSPRNFTIEDYLNFVKSGGLDADMRSDLDHSDGSSVGRKPGDQDGKG